MSTVSELAKSVDGRYRDSMINVGCINPTKVAGTRLSLYSINLEMVPTTYGPTIKSLSPKVTVNNDAVFARLVQSLWRDLGEVRANYACKQADPTPSGGVAPLSKTVCNKLAGLWALAEIKNDLCVLSTFGQSNATQASICASAKQAVIAFEAALPAHCDGTRSVQSPRRAAGAYRRVPARLGRTVPQVDQDPGLLPREGDLRALTRVHRHLLALALAALTLGGCATLSQTDPLQVMVAGIEPLQEKGEGLELRLLVKLRVQNPNSSPVSYDGAYVKVEVQDKTFATGVSNTPGTVAGFSEEIIEVPVTVSMLRMVRQVMAMKDGAPADQIRYSMSGKLGSHRFSANGEFSLKPETPVDAT